MNNDSFDQIFKTTKNMSAPLGEMGKALSEIFQRTLQQNLEMMGDNFARTSEQLKRLSRTRRVEDFLNAQKDCVSENITAAIENTQKILHIATENLQDLSSLGNSQMQSSIKQTKENIK